MKTRSTFFSLAVILVLLASLVFQVTPSQALAGTYFTTTDNENNAHTGTADGDMDVDIYNDNPLHPIEFNIIVPVGGLPDTDAFLAVRAWDVDEEAGQKDEVFLNDTSLGFLSGTNNTWNTTAFQIPAGLLVEGTNRVQINVDTLNPPPDSTWLVAIDWGQIAVDGGIGTPGRINSITVTGFSEAGGTVTLDVDVVVEALADGTFDLETNIYDPSGNSPAADLQAGFAMTAGQIVTKSIQFTFPAGTVGDVYTLRGFLFDTATGLLNSIKSTTWTYNPTPAPTIGGIAPNAGPVAGGTTVVITGTNLTGGTVTFGGLPATCTVDSPTQITCTTPAHAAGPVDVVVTTPGGPATSGGGFTYMDPPTIGGIAPNSGPQAGGTSVVITGTNLTGGTVTFGGTAAVCTVDSPTQITCTSPAHAPGLVDVVVTTPGGPATSAGGFTYIPAPTIGSIVPNSGPTTGGTSVVITGTNLTGGTVTFGGLPATCTVDSPTQITCTSPAHAAGAVDVVVTTPGGAATSAGGFTYIPQVITSITPNSGPTGGGTAVTIVGYGFTGATSIKFGGTDGTCTVISDTQINCTTPAHEAGPVDVVIIAPLGTVTSPGGFTYVAPVFTLTASGAATVKPGDQYVYTFTYTTSAKAFNAQVVFSLPGHTTYVSNNGGYACATASGVVTCTLGAISTNGSFAATLQVDKLKKVNTPLTLQATTYVMGDDGAAIVNGAPTVTANTLTPFADVFYGNPALDHIQSVWAYGITGGCLATNPLTYCPNRDITRAEMSVFIEKGVHGSAFVPPIVGLTYTDTSTNFAKYWIESLAADAITGGCGGTKYCPNSYITRAQMSVFLLRGKYGPTFMPAVPTGTVWLDVSSTYWAARWTERLGLDGITAGCGNGNFCPDKNVSRSEMAVLVQRTFNLPMPTP